jgi:hypothetical protein
MIEFLRLLGDAIGLLAFACVIYLLACMFINQGD